MDNKLIPQQGAELMHLLHANKDELTALNPFSRDILLFETHVAGTTHIDGIEEIVKGLAIGGKLNFFREPNNDYDELAIVVKVDPGIKIGYVPKRDNIVFSRLMDAGKLLFGKIAGIEDINGWLKIKMEIYLHE